MRFSATALLAGLCASSTLITEVAADRMEVNMSVAFGIIRYPGRFITDYGVYPIDASPGCRGTPVPGMIDFCVDMDKRRAHFQFSHQEKRCLHLTSTIHVPNLPTPGKKPSPVTYINLFFDERPCTW